MKSFDVRFIQNLYSKLFAQKIFWIKRVVFVSTLLIFPTAAMADADASKSALAKAQYMLRQTTTEKAGLEKEIAAQKATIASLEKDIAQIKKAATVKQSESGAQMDAINQLKENGQKLHERISADTEKYRQLNTANEQLQDHLEKQSHNFDVCYDNNKKLYQINQEILGKYKDKGFLSVLSHKEPITSLGDVKVENLIQDYQYQIEKLTVKLVTDKSQINNYTKQQV